MGGMTIGLPSGWGDLSWAWSKLCAVKDEIAKIEVAQGWPPRGVDFVRLWDPKFQAPEAADFGPFEYGTILSFEMANGLSVDAGKSPAWEQLYAMRESARVLIQPNRHLERGMPLAEWLPDLPTNYHYPFHTTEKDAKKAREMIDKALPGNKAPVVAISCASYRGSESWRTWQAAEWIDCIARIKAEGWQPLLVGGFWDDLTQDVAAEADIPCIAGKTSTGVCIEQLRIVDSYIGYSSGLNVVRTVLNKPAFAIWPDFEGFSQAELSWSWAPPHMIEEGRYVARLWRPVDTVWPAMKSYLRRCSDERDQAKRPSLVA